MRLIASPIKGAMVSRRIRPLAATASWAQIVSVMTSSVSAEVSTRAAAALKETGAEDVVAYCTHGVLSGGAVARVDTSVLTELVITDSICLGEAATASAKIRLLTIAPLIGEAIKRIADESSVSSLFD